MDHLDALEAESVYILREAFAEAGIRHLVSGWSADVLGVDAETTSDPSGLAL